MKQSEHVENKLQNSKHMCETKGMLHTSVCVLCSWIALGLAVVFNPVKTDVAGVGDDAVILVVGYT